MLNWLQSPVHFRGLDAAYVCAEESINPIALIIQILPVQLLCEQICETVKQRTRNPLRMTKISNEKNIFQQWLHV